MTRRIAPLFISLLLANLALSDEGMYPISEIQKLNFRAKGLQIDPKEVYNPNGISLIDAVVQIGGCTGSFVSNEGLILTNHHCAFSAVQAASSADRDYVTHGLLARTREEEIPAPSLTVRITESYRDVSKEVLSVVTEGMDLAQRTRAITRRSNEIVDEAERANPGKRVEVSEMFAGRTYVLFVYTFLRDVRLVYVPPRSVGEFGGEYDNWVWPRHTGDFSFARVYVAPDGSPAPYSPANVPYMPRRFLKVNPAGAEEGDFVFLLGYPGRTFRHQPSQFIEYQQHYRLPYTASLYEWQIRVMEELGKGDRSVAIKHDARIKSLANVMKRSRGQVKGMERLNLVERKQQEERDLQMFIEANAQRKKTYGTMLKEIATVYADMTARAESELILEMLLENSLTSPTMLRRAFILHEASLELQKADVDRLSAYQDRNLNTTKSALLRGFRDYYEPTDRAFLKELLLQAASLPSDQRLPAIEKLVGGSDPEPAIDRFIDTAFKQSKLGDEELVLNAVGKTPTEVAAIDDPFLRLIDALYPTLQQVREAKQRREGALSRLSALYVDVKEQWLKTAFIPDANRTLRLTYGYVRGYSPADATYYSPITTLRGVIEKTTDEPPFNTPQEIIDLYRAKQFGRYKHAKLNDVPVAILYNTDTSGGNSGSPVINARGELVGVNFDRAFEATINDFAWSESYSRSIAVDIRYVLWVTEMVGKAPHLLKEMGVK
jgi:hypothetical protein